VIDARDTEYIWCNAKIGMIINSVGRETLLVVHYDGWNNYYDELLPINSSRLAPSGVYTKRDDIPKYKLRNSEAMQGRIINRFHPSKEKEAEVKKEGDVEGKLEDFFKQFDEI